MTAVIVLLAALLLVQMDHTYGVLYRLRTSRIGRAVLALFGPRLR